MTTLDAVDVARIRRDKPLYTPDEISAILADLGVDAKTSNGRLNQLHELFRTKHSPRSVIKALALREIEVWERSP